MRRIDRPPMGFATTSVVAILIALLSALPLSSPAETPAAVPAGTHTLYLVRHGAYLPDPKVDPESGPGLTPLGIAQARLIAARLRGLPLHFDSMTSSTMTRARETAAVIHETLPDVPQKQSSQLSECTPPAFRAFKDEPAEAQNACAHRLDEAFAEFFAPAKGKLRNDLIVAHANVIRYLVTKALHVDARTWLNISVAHASLTVIRVQSDGTMRVLIVGDVGHLPPNMQSWGTDSDPQLIAPDTQLSSVQ